MNSNSFSDEKNLFDEKYGDKLTLKPIVSINGKFHDEVKIKNNKNERNEEYYKWQFIYSLINSYLFNKDFIGTEVRFPKGNPSADPIILDGAIFDDKNWIEHYNNYWKTKNQSELEWLRKHLAVTIEFKNENGNDIKKYVNQQLFPAMKESEKDLIFGIYYDSGRLYLFRKNILITNKILRFDESKNKKGNNSGIDDLSLELTDSYLLIPSYKNLNKKSTSNRKNRYVEDLEKISSISENKLNEALSKILRTLSEKSLYNEIGNQLLIEILAIKLFDEMESQNNKKPLNFYIEPDESSFNNLSDENISTFLNRIKSIFNEAKGKYSEILGNSVIKWTIKSHVYAIITIVQSFQDYTFILSTKSNLYQLVFYKFSSEFAKERRGQFLTPINLIEFLVQIVNPRGTDKIIDPCAGTSDFLSISYFNSDPKLDDNNLFGIDNDDQMIRLSQLNMLLNGDGNAKLKYVEDKGSINHKFNIQGEIVKQIPSIQKNGNWDNWADDTELMKFDVVLTNPPFGEDRKYEVKNKEDEEVISLYELWELNKINNWIDLGVIFLENAVRLLKENGRLGIVLSNSIASIERWSETRKWLLNNLRVVALFDLPANVFADTGVNTTLIVGYKPSKEKLSKLKNENYDIFIRDIKKVGYEVRTSKRIKFFNNIYKIDEETFEIEIDSNGESKLDEEFSEIVKDFKKWAITQEKDLIDTFIGGTDELH